MWAAALGGGRPMVIDADALNLLAQQPQQREGWVLTPHPGEAGRLLQISSTEVNQDRYAAVAAIQRHFGGIALLKGAGSLLIGSDGLTRVATGGNPGMATGGMGDVLTGVIAGLIGQGLPPLQAATVGVQLHGRAGDLAARRGGERGLLAGDLMKRLRQLANHRGSRRRP